MQAQDKNNMIDFLLEKCLRSKTIVQDKVKQQIADILHYKSVLLKSVLQYVLGKIGGHDIKNTIVLHNRGVANVVHINRAVSDDLHRV